MCGKADLQQPAFRLTIFPVSFIIKQLNNRNRTYRHFPEETGQGRMSREFSASFRRPDNREEH